MKRTDAQDNDGNRFKDRDLINGTDGTRVDQTWLNSVQEELAAIIEWFGGILDPSDENQAAAILMSEYSRRVQYSDLIDGWIVSGMTASFAGLDVTVATGVSITEGTRTELKTGEATRSFTVAANNDTYVSIRKTGVIETASVANGGTQPSINGLLLYKVISDGTTVTSITRLAANTPQGLNGNIVYADLGGSWVASGLGWSDNALNIELGAGVVIIDGIRIAIDGSAAERTVTLVDNSENIISVNQDGTFTVTAIAQGAAMPVVSGLPLWWMKTLGGSVFLGQPPVELIGFRKKHQESSSIHIPGSGGTLSVPGSTYTDMISTDQAIQKYGYSVTLEADGFHAINIPDGVSRVTIESHINVNNTADVFIGSLSIYKNGVLLREHQINSLGNTSLEITARNIDVVAGDKISIRYFHYNSTTVDLNKASEGHYTTVVEC